MFLYNFEEVTILTVHRAQMLAIVTHEPVTFCNRSRVVNDVS